MSSNAKRLGDAVLSRREELDLTQIEVWQAGGPSNTTLTVIENGKQTSLGRATARKLDKGLRWVEGSARTLWEGGEPTPIEAVEGVMPDLLAELEKVSPATRDYILGRLGIDRPQGGSGSGVSAV